LVTRRVPSKGFTMYPTLILLSQVQRSARSGLISAPNPQEGFTLDVDWGSEGDRSGIDKIGHL
jgi:hypothetical protein